MAASLHPKSWRDASSFRSKHSVHDGLAWACSPAVSTGATVPLEIAGFGGGPKAVRLGVRPVGSAGVDLQMTLAACGTSGGVQG